MSYDYNLFWHLYRHELCIVSDETTQRKRAQNSPSLNYFTEVFVLLQTEHTNLGYNLTRKKAFH